MTDVVCAGCGSTQRAGAPFCAACGREFPRTGRPVAEPAQVPQGQVQQAAAAAAARGGSGSVPLVESRPPITTEVEVYTATQIPAAGSVPPPLVAPYAGVGKRFVAWLIDGAIAGVLIGIVAGIGISFIDIPSGLVVVSQEQAAEIAAQMMRVYLLACLVGFAFQLSMWIWESRTGRTVGNSAMGLRTLSAEDRAPIGFVREILRVLVLAAGAVVLAVGQIVVLLSPLWDKGGKVQGWHDKAARSVVVDVRAPQVAGTGLTPVAAGPRAPGKPAVRPTAPAAPASSPYGQMPPLSPAAPQAPAQPAVAAPDPWAFPQAPAQGAPAAGGDGLITGIPGSAPSAPPAQQAPAQQQAPSQPVQQQPYQQPSAQQPVQQPVQQQPYQQQPAPQQPPVQQPAQQPGSAWPARTWPVQQEQAAQQQAPQQEQAPQQQAPAGLPPQQHPESRPTRGVGHPQNGAPAQPAPAAPPAQAALPPQRDEVSDATRMQAPVLEPAAVVTVTVELESGERRVIDGPALVGRNPQAADGASYILVRVEDPTRSVSKNHAELGVDSAGLWLTDRGSTNGTVVSAPGRSPQVAEPGARVRVPVGATIHVGDRRLVVHAAEPRA
ncbi:RDD family protein [Promicromonospora sukumoe]|uniref:RDD family protein n=1 Tax=Promicromonospora sukumoe TaxID=88382 RepID=UPI0036687023